MTSSTRQKITILAALSVTILFFTVIHFRHLIPSPSHTFTLPSSLTLSDTLPNLKPSAKWRVIGEWKGIDLDGRGGSEFKQTYGKGGDIGKGGGKGREMHGNGGEICDSFYVDDVAGCAEVVGEVGMEREREGEGKEDV